MYQEEELVERRRHHVKFCEGWLQHKTHKQHGGSYWDKLWLVLKGNIVYIFKSTDTAPENQVGNLTLDTDSKFVNRGGDREKGFKFDLTTGKRLNTFRTEKNSERELWRAYVLGLSRGHVPSDIDLLDSEVKKIQNEIDAYISGKPVPNRDNEDFYRQSGISKSSSDESGVGASIDAQSGFSVAKSPSYTGSGSSGSRSASTFVENGGPTMVHKFYDDRSRDQTPPSWFFSHCSRQQAETILEKGAQYGNTLIRESTSYKDNGSYVISKLVLKQGMFTFEHYEVMRTAGGYKVNVENPHEAMRSLSQVMEYFVRTSGGYEHTRPMETNNLTLLGLHDPDYDRHIPRGDFSFLDDDPGHDYEEPASPTSPGRPSSMVSKSFGPADSRNISGILKKDRTANIGKTVGFNPISHTVAGSRYARQKDIPSMNELVVRHQEAAGCNWPDHDRDAELQNLDNVIGGFESDHLYVNEEEINKFRADPPRQRQASDIAPPPPPLPDPHRPPLNKQSYVNVPAPDQLESASVIQNLPVAPPAPRDPILRSSMAAPVSTLQSTTGKTKLHASHSFSQNSSTIRPIASVQPTTPVGSATSQNRHFQKSHSEEQFKSPAQQAGSPSSFPSWKDNLKPVKQNQKLENITDAKDVSESEHKSGVDAGNPGGVNTLRSRFERTSTGDSTAVIQKAFRPGGGFNRGRKSLSAILPMTNTEDDMYEILPEETESPSRSWSVSSDSKSNSGFFLPTELYHRQTSRAKSKVLNETSGSQIEQNKPINAGENEGEYDDVAPADEFYDDTVAPGDEVIYKADPRKVQFQVTNEPESNSRLTQRRKTEPCVSFSKKEFEGLNQEFKNKLEGLMSGVQPGPPGMGPKSPTSSRPTSKCITEDHVYAELPPIEPDEVFYVNERFNGQT